MTLQVALCQNPSEDRFSSVAAHLLHDFLELVISKQVLVVFKQARHKQVGVATEHRF